MRDFLFVDNSDVCPVYNHFSDIHSRNVHYFDGDLYNGSRSKVNMPIENPFATYYLMA